MPELDYTRKRHVTVTEAIHLGIKPHALVTWEKMNSNARVLIVEDEEGLHELVITKDYSYDVADYTSYQFIYEVNFIYTELRTKQFFEYVKEHLKEGQEIWRVWIGHEEDVLTIPYTRYSYKELSLNHLKPLFNWKHEKYKLQNCLVIERG